MILVISNKSLCCFIWRYRYWS